MILMMLEINNNIWEPKITVLLKLLKKRSYIFHLCFDLLISHLLQKPAYKKINISVGRLIVMVVGLSSVIIHYCLCMYSDMVLTLLSVTSFFDHVLSGFSLKLHASVRIFYEMSSWLISHLTQYLI